MKRRECFAMTTGRSPIRTGMRVVGDDGQQVGQVRDVHDFDFIMTRSGKPPLYVPFEAVEQVSDDLVVLNIPAKRVDIGDWAEASTEE
jgi:hypothetical protein